MATLGIGARRFASCAGNGVAGAGTSGTFGDRRRLPAGGAPSWARDRTVAALRGRVVTARITSRWRARVRATADQSRTAPGRLDGARSGAQHVPVRSRVSPRSWSTDTRPVVRRSAGPGRAVVPIVGATVVPEPSS